MNNFLSVVVIPVVSKLLMPCLQKGKALTEIPKLLNYPCSLNPIYNLATQGTEFAMFVYEFIRLSPKKTTAETTAIAITAITNEYSTRA
jgi:hypothetical protein